MSVCTNMAAFSKPILTCNFSQGIKTVVPKVIGFIIYVIIIAVWYFIYVICLYLTFAEDELYALKLGVRVLARKSSWKCKILPPYCNWAMGHNLIFSLNDHSSGLFSWIARLSTQNLFSLFYYYEFEAHTLRFYLLNEFI